MSFAAEYKKLNPEQKLAVDYINGPLMVIAGPGTGKTQLLSLRVANILKKTDTDADAILCLTFTNKAAVNMQDRLLSLIGPESSKVAVKTFHSFAAEIMNRHPEYFWSGARLAIAPDAIQLEIVQEILRQLPANHPLTLKFSGQYTLIRDVQDAVKLVKEAGLTPEALTEIIKANLVYIDQIEPIMVEIGEQRLSAKSLQAITKKVLSLPEQPSKGLSEPFKALQEVIIDSFQQAVALADEAGKLTPISKWKSRWVQTIEGERGMRDERRRNEWWLAVSDVYERYRKLLHNRGYYDYADMLVEVIKQITEQPELKTELQEYYQYLLIDEFQDTNAAQLHLAQLVADHPLAEGRPNLMVVGDDDQSIFKFQGAELSNMRNFPRRYQNSKVIVLTQNYRSTQQVLDSAARIINHSDYRLVKDFPNFNKNIKAASQQRPGVVEHLSFQSRPEQLTGLAKQIQKWHESGQSVAVLARSHTSLRDMAHTLNNSKVAIRYEQNNNIFDKEGVQQALIVIRLLQAIIKGDSSLASELLSLTIRHPMWQISPTKAWDFAVSNYSSKDWYSALLTSKETHLKNLAVWLQELVQLATQDNAAVVLEAVIGLRQVTTHDSPFKNYYLRERKVDQNYLETLAAFQLLRTLVSEFCGNKQPKIAEFVAFIDLMEDNSRILADTTPFQSGDHYVELLTVYKAKGLEFDSVVVLDATKNEWSPSIVRRKPPANLPLHSAAEDSDDYSRLMYVAATRAHSNFVVGSYQKSIKGEEIITTPLVAEFKSHNVAPQKSKELQSTLETTLMWPRLSEIDEKRLLKTHLEDYSMSVTHLLNFLDVTKGGPEHFFERNILRLPSAKSPALATGTAVHDALELAQNLVNQNKFKLQAVQEQFQKSLMLEALSHDDYKKQLSVGTTTLNDLFTKIKFKPTMGAKPEYKIADLRCGQAIINGKLDVLTIDDQTTLISDYKTGRPLLSLKAKSGEEAVKAWKHRTQLIYYALLAQLSPNLTSKTITCEMLYVQAKSQKEFRKSYSPTPDDITRLSSLIQAIWDKVINLDFPDSSKYSKDLQGIQAFEYDLLNAKV